MRGLYWKPSKPGHVWSRNGVGSTGEGAKFLMNMDGTPNFRRNVWVQFYITLKKGQKLHSVGLIIQLWGPRLIYALNH
jgi:hypothetical protein